ncbi:MAG: hypothetical protein UT14_C0038G0011 [Candidatus Shapirobacteria bacterium GW2011_GWE1_38_92]|uniref:Uncharacterized protein n=3 Tax=Candidatus Shapironibacteriota TaxID=1752721 RepID=A0A0G0M527_9BACT|nr:MAG: hypothetical protein US90_C0021G0002 [Candidatus Shapirobacteria bacterium GW2011_GWE2_38_30]KKQ90412.1 MAG: hypothetical protein UT14_C0038G0011 [Candidatus Shapirobacteria bacterium GW2011_GWE1_38_92]OGL56261.1 MAG: hypothetical protein A2367_03270 [Candidatus Shapirobacteria bacterium RIFOXYB1_FULL_38_38]OGL56505.1 MAG: hypothetical protein A2195_00480 [Candidatus Shapirobacteria bacterium RIFOXYA1_FULL_39_17]HAP38085.1 hypothetical protein [Candidatus Shapirobacteria bacterium]
MNTIRTFEKAVCFGPTLTKKDDAFSGLCRGRVISDGGKKIIVISGCTEGRTLTIEGVSSRFCHLTDMKEKCRFRADPDVELVKIRKKVRKR